MRQFIRPMVAVTVAAGIVTFAHAIKWRDDLGAREARLLAQVRAEGASNPDNLIELARVREQMGKLDLAVDTWGLLEKRHGQKTAWNESSAPDHTYGELADFWIQRLRRKRNLRAHPPTPPDAALRRRLWHALHPQGEYAALGGRDGQIDLMVQADLDGDLIDEVLLVGKYGPLTKRTKPFMCLAKWDGSEYRIVWRNNGLRLFPFAFDVIDRDGDGWKEIGCGFERDTGNASTLWFNGIAAIWSW